jgi:hypothetical protein
MWLWSALDEHGRHRRRYTRRQIRRLFEEAAIDVLLSTSSVSLLLPIVAASRLRHRRVLDSYDPFRELALPDRVNRVLGGVMTVERKLITTGASLPVGSSLLMVGRRR